MPIAGSQTGSAVVNASDSWWIDAILPYPNQPIGGFPDSGRGSVLDPIQQPTLTATAEAPKTVSKMNLTTAQKIGLLVLAFAIAYFVFKKVG